MADIRIKDLTTEVSSTATGDFFVIDGTTGTRKTPAFNPTFGGNATVTGTLNVNGTDRSQMVGNANTRLEVGNSIEDQRAHIGLVNRLNLGNPIFSKNLAGKSASDAYTTIATTPASGYSGIECGYGGVIRLLNGTGATTAGAEVTPIAVLDTNTTRVAIPLATPSTTTSSGALVVSGGVGVGGDIHASNVSSFSSGAVRAKIDSSGQVSWGVSANQGILTWDTGKARIGGQGTNDVYLVTNSTAERVKVAYSDGAVSVLSTTASNTTSSGALVVSGGVGIAKQIVAGGVISIDPLDASPEDLAPEVAFCRGVSLATTASVLAFGSGARIGLLRGYQDGGNLVEWRFGSYIGTTFNEQMRLGGTSATSSSLTLYGTTASTSTSSGALVVSGGVGVAGSINTDGTLRFNANSSLPGTGSLGISSTYGLNFYASTGSSYDFTVFSAAGQSILLVPTGTRNVSFSGTLTTIGNITSGAAITTSAPVGGAGLWELGLYSSTAPSATGYVTIEIGGTVYKLLASNV